MVCVSQVSRWYGYEVKHVWDGDTSVRITADAGEALTPEGILEQAKQAAHELRELRARWTEMAFREARGKELASQLFDAWGDGKVSDLYLATLASAYVEISGVPELKVMPTLGRLLDRSPNTIKMHLVRARDRGLLTGEPGKTGGKLTAQARKILKSNRPA
jgi:hypothetical protein